MELSYTQFKHIVGETKLTEFESIANEEAVSDNENFRLLYNIWKHYQTDLPLSSEIPRAFTPEDNISEHVVTNVVENEILSPTSPEDVLKTITNTIPTKENESPTLKIVNNSLLGNFLISPKTPERKGKRDVERLPFAVTSDRYKEMLKAKREQKRKIEEGKTERKRRKQEKKENKDGLTVQQRITFPKPVTRKIFPVPQKKKLECSTTNDCKICSRFTSLTASVVDFPLRKPNCLCANPPFSATSFSSLSLIMYS